jgi:putative pyruvate formate lyase activating enzyme
MPNGKPAYLELHARRLLKPRAEEAWRRMEDCTLCPRLCHVNRKLGAQGAACRTGTYARVSSFGPHHGEERPLSGRRGSGTIFFANCNLACVFCQNWEISQRGEGQDVTADELAAIMLDLQEMGCHNINLVSPSHVVAQFLAALAIAAERGLRLPLIYNSGGYDRIETLQLLAGIVDVYMPDMKFADSQTAAPYLGVKDYAEINRAAVQEMHRQVGDLIMNDTGIAQRGLLVRHLVLTDNLAGTDQIIPFLARDISSATYLNLMDQYRPCYRADQFPALRKRPSHHEMKTARALAREWGMNRLD